jgi:hypothetical protein
MSSLIKCPKCSTWNENRDYCSQCNELLNAEIRREENAKKQWEEYQSRPKDAFDLYFERIKNSDKPLDKFMHIIFRSAWVLLILLVLTGLAVAAVGPG